MTSSSAEVYVIRKNGYFYRPDKAGYCASVYEAGRYEQSDAEAEAAHCEGVTAHPLSEWLKDTATGPFATTLDEVLALRSENARLREALDASVKAVPTTWLDPLLSGKDKIEFPASATKPLERLLQAVTKRIQERTTAILGRDQASG